MKVILTRNAGIRGQAYGQGTHLELADEDAQTLINLGKARAEPVPEIEKPTTKEKGKNKKKAEEESGTEESIEDELKGADEQHPDDQ